MLPERQLTRKEPCLKNHFDSGPGRSADSTLRVTQTMITQDLTESMPITLRLQAFPTQAVRGELALWAKQKQWQNKRKIRNFKELACLHSDYGLSGKMLLIWN